MTREADNPMAGSDFDWMVSNHAVWGWKAPVKASVSGVSLLQLSPFFASIFPLFPQKRLILRLFSQFSRPLCILQGEFWCWSLLELKGLMSKTTTLHMQHAFFYKFLWPSSPNYNVKWLNTKFITAFCLRMGTATAVNFISFWTRSWSHLFSSNLLSLLSNWETWNNHEKVWKGCKVWFSATFSLASPLSRQLFMILSALP